MDAIKYFKERKRMINSIGGNDEDCSAANCRNCPIGHHNNDKNVPCTDFQNHHPEEAVAIVEKWSQEHPRKTMLEDFLEKFPKAPLKKGIPKFACPKYLGYTDTEDICDGKCVDCWNRPLEE